MPGFDKTGPQGLGPMSGKPQGNCRTARSEMSREPGVGYGQGRGRRQGRGFGCGVKNRLGRRNCWGSNQTQPSVNDLNE